MSGATRDSLGDLVLEKTQIFHNQQSMGLFQVNRYLDGNGVASTSFEISFQPLHLSEAFQEKSVAFILVSRCRYPFYSGCNFDTGMIF